MGVLQKGEWKMGSENRRLIVKSKHDFKNYEYEVNGKSCQRQEAVDMILDLMAGKSMTMQEIGKELKINKRSMFNLIKVMRENNLITNTKLRRDRHYLFKTKDDCLIATYLYPSAKEIEDSFTIKDRKTYKAEDTKVVSYNTKTIVKYATTSLDFVS